MSICGDSLRKRILDGPKEPDSSGNDCEIVKHWFWCPEIVESGFVSNLDTTGER